MTLKNRIRSKWRREASRRLGCRMWTMQNADPLISFTFDDFPASALHVAGPILAGHGIAGTYYTSFGLMGTVAPTGQIFSAADLAGLFAAGHELGCHTYDHRHSYETSPEAFEASIIANLKALRKLAPGRRFHSLAYPISGPRPATKPLCARHFPACRSGGQRCNQGRIDLNAMKGFFLEQSRDNFSSVRAAISETVATRGWLIFATHDVCADPTPYGVKSEFFRRTVAAAVGSGAHLVSVSEGLRRIGLAGSELPHAWNHGASET